MVVAGRCERWYLVIVRRNNEEEYWLQRISMQSSSSFQTEFGLFVDPTFSRESLF